MTPRQTLSFLRDHGELIAAVALLIAMGAIAVFCGPPG
jgi:hypothetical protein